MDKKTRKTKGGADELTTLDKWLSITIEKDKEENRSKSSDTVKEEGKTSKTITLEGQDKKNYLTALIRDFENKIKLPEIVDNNKYYDLRQIINTNYINKILIVTEKPKVAQAFAKAITKKPRIKSVGRKLRIFNALFNGINVSILPLTGHIIELTTRKEYSGNWENTDPLKLIEDPKAIIERVKYPEIEKAIAEEVADADLFLIATDADEEGANIGYEAYKIAKKYKKDINVYQLWFLSLEPKELFKSLLKPIEPKWNWAYSVQARRIIDAIVGFTSTRELTIFLKEQLDKLGLKVASIGRVQTPTLYLIYLREKEIEEFKPRPYWVLIANVLIGETPYEFRHRNSPIYDKNKALMIFEKLKEEKKAWVTEIKVKQNKILPPPPLNTTRALTEINRLFGIDSKTAIKILEDLYLSGLITYPRTDTDRYPQDFDHKGTLEKLVGFSEYSEIIRLIITRGAKLKRNGRKLIGDHLPITPIDYPKPNDRRLPNEKYKRIYEFVLTRYLALFLDPAQVEKREIFIRIKDELFSARDNKIVDLGFYAVYQYDVPKESSIPISEAGIELNVRDISIKEDKTKPPSPLSEFELIGLMEKLGLGTKSTRPEHIQKLVDRGYITRKNKTLRITQIGKTLMEQLEKIWSDFVKPYFSANIHKMMREVMNGQLTEEEMIKRARNEFLKLFKELRNHLQKHGQIIISAYEREMDSKKVVSCPKCGGAMIKIDISPKASKLICTKCKFNVVVPKFKKIEILSDIKCAICGSNPVVLHRKRKLFVCLNCFKEIGPCFKCPKLNECPVGELIKREEERMTVGWCDQCDSPALYVPEKRFVICKDCVKSVVYNLPKRGAIYLTNKQHDKCGWRLFRIRTGKKSYLYCAKCGEVVEI